MKNLKPNIMKQLNFRSTGKNLITSIGMLILLVSLLLIGCDGVDDSIDTGQVNYNSMTEFFKENGVKTQDFSIDASQGGTIKAEGGTEITIPADAFVDNAYNTITGNVKVEVREIFTASKMILSNKPTNAVNLNGENTFLLSEGETEFVATQNGTPININQETASVTIKVPAKAVKDVDMLPFTGLATDESGILWNVSTRATKGFTYATNPATYSYQSFTTGWTNCDKFYQYTGDKTTNFIDLSTSPNAAETSVFIAFKSNDLPAVVKLFTNYADGVKSYADSLPVDLEVTFVAICVHENQQYMAVKKQAIVEDEILSLDFKPVSSRELVDTLETLD